MPNPPVTIFANRMSVVDLDPNRTIAAIASALGPAMRGIVRLSGPQTLACLNRLCNPEIAAPQGARSFATHLRLTGITSPVSANILLWPDSRSYTRQQSAEIHLIGSLPVVEALVDSLCQNGAALACPGEFTLRAFLAGRLDLSQAEAVIGAVEASNETEFAIAMAQSAGGLRDPLDKLRNELLELLAHLEAGLDFVEDDIQFISRTELQSAIQEIQTAVQSIIRQISNRNLNENGWRVALIGRPNVGKSSLFNALVGRSAAIATDVAGTTRDYLVESLSFGAFEIRLIDTAGLDSSNIGQLRPNEIENEGRSQAFDRPIVSIHELAQMRSREVTAQSNLQLLCIERGQELDAWEEQILREAGDDLLCVATKADLQRAESPTVGIPVSALTGQGLDELKSKICERLDFLSHRAAAYLPTVARCAESLALADHALQRAADELRDQAGDEIIAAEFRAALEHLGRIVGAVYTDEILDRIFSRFCIGK